MTDARPSVLSETEERFCHEYVQDLNATRAYLRVFPTVKEGSARTLGARMLAKVHIRARIEQLQADLYRRLEERAVVTREWVLGRLRENVERAMQAEPLRDRQGNPTGEYTYQGSVANQALGLLGKELGMFGDKLEVMLPPEEAKRRMLELLSTAAQRRKGAA